MSEELTVVVKPSGRPVKGRPGLQWASFWSPTLSGRFQVPVSEKEWRMCEIVIKPREAKDA